MPIDIFRDFFGSGNGLATNFRYCLFQTDFSNICDRETLHRIKPIKLVNDSSIYPHPLPSQKDYIDILSILLYFRSKIGIKLPN